MELCRIGIRWGKRNNLGFYWWVSPGRHVYLRPRFQFGRHSVFMQILNFSFDWLTLKAFREEPTDEQ